MTCERCGELKAEGVERLCLLCWADDHFDGAEAAEPVCERCRVRKAGFGYSLCLTCEVDRMEEIAAKARRDTQGKPSEMWRFHGVPRNRMERIIAEADEPSAPGTWRNPQ